MAIADMGPLPVGLLSPFRQLRYLNISGNSLDNMALQVIDPCRELEVSCPLIECAKKQAIVKAVLAKQLLFKLSHATVA